MRNCCPYCRSGIVASIAADGSVAAFVIGEVFACLGCGEPVVVGPEFVLRKPTAGELFRVWKERGDMLVKIQRTVRRRKAVPRA